jgi:branched-chain amino acid transport system ATP-binding protein
MSVKSNSYTLDVQSINAFYGKAQILFDMSLGIGRGEVVVLLGRNGAGKTTTSKSIMGIVKPKGGKIQFNGREIQDLPPYKTCGLGLGYVPEDRRVFAKLTVLENLEVGRQPERKGLEPWTPKRLFALFPNLAERCNQLAGTLSGGEQQMLTIARTLMGNPEVVILDEPSEGLAPVIVDQLAATIRKIKNEGVSILLAEQNLSFAKRICDRAYLIYHGSVCHESPLDQLDSEEYEKYCSI